MSWALERAVGEVRDDLKRYGIEVNLPANIVIVNDIAHKLEPRAEYRIILRNLKHYIKLAKEAERKKIEARQGRLL